MSAPCMSPSEWVPEWVLAVTAGGRLSPLREGQNSVVTGAPPAIIPFVTFLAPGRCLPAGGTCWHTAIFRFWCHVVTRRVDAEQVPKGTQGAIT
jgi:hypothetical protein